MPVPARPAAKKRRPVPSRRITREPAPERILAAALAAFAARGFDGATTREIAADAGVPQGLLAYHFESKQALWEAAADWVFAALAADLGQAPELIGEADPRSRLRATLRRFVRFSAAHPELHRFMVHEGSHDGPRLHWLVEKHIRPLFAASTALIRAVAPGANAEQLHYLILGAAAHLFAVAPEFEHLTGRSPLAPELVEAQAAAVVDLIVGAARKQTRKKRSGR